MAKTTIEKLNEFGQSVWLDNISRSMIDSGKLEKMISLGLRGITSNPSIFDKSIRLTDDYDKKIEELCNSGKSIFDIYDDLTVGDIQDAADILKKVYDQTQGLDGYVSLEVNPKLAFDRDATVKDAKRLFEKVNRQNVMFKIPATDAGFEAIETLIAEGININATLIFSLEQYIKTAKAYLNGIKKLKSSGKDLRRVHSVASIFVSRVDTTIDNMIGENERLLSLKGRAAVSNSKLIYSKYLEMFSSDEFKSLKENGANLQRVLWASTSTKNPEYSDIKYVTELIGKDTVNTLPDATLDAFLDHGIIEEALSSDITEANSIIDALRIFGINTDNVCEKLLQDGIKSFEKSFDTLLSSIEKKTRELCNIEELK